MFTISFRCVLVFGIMYVRNGLQVSLLILINSYPPENHGFLIISGWIVVNYFAQIRSILEAKFGDDPLKILSGKH